MEASRARYDTAQHDAAQARDNTAHAQAQAEQLNKQAQQQRGTLSKCCRNRGLGISEAIEVKTSYGRVYRFVT